MRIADLKFYFAVCVALVILYSIVAFSGDGSSKSAQSTPQRSKAVSVSSTLP
jgi:hypothetical protein